MTTYSAITAGQIDANSFIDTTLAGQWTNNLIAMFEGDASASAERLAAGALKTLTGTFAGTSSTNTKTNFALNGPAFFPMIHCTSITMKLSGHATDSAAGYDNPRLSISNQDWTNYSVGKAGAQFYDHSTTGTYDIDYRYMDV